MYQRVKSIIIALKFCVPFCSRSSDPPPPKSIHSFFISVCGFFFSFLFRLDRPEAFIILPPACFQRIILASSIVKFGNFFLDKSQDTIFEMSYTHCEKYLRKLNVYDLAFRISVLKILNYMNNIKQ